MASMAAHHAEWLSLMEVSGPFLSVPVLKDALPNGLDAHDPRIAADVRAALEQWADPDLGDPGSERAVDTHFAFVQFVMHEVLGFDTETMSWDSEHSPDWGGVSAGCVIEGDTPLMPVAVFWPDTPVDQILAEFGTDSPQDRMVEHLKDNDLRVGLVTDGERWTLVSYQEGENPGFATWWSSLWAEEKITLQAFRTLLHEDRFMTLGEDETIGALLDRSSEDQREVTTKLGNQTLEAVEILIRTIDRIDQENGGELLREVEEQKGIAELYDAAVTVMMRLIFLFYAEENDLLPMSEPLYVERYAASSLRERLQAAADEHGEEVLESTHDGWPRLLSTWRAVYGGVEHGDMVLAPYGGSLFDPDRYPFLEGRQPGSSWTEEEAIPLKIDNRTVLHLLNALQTLDEGGQRRKLSFRALDVEQIGHVYEGMLDHTAARAKGWVLGLSGTGGKEPEIELDQLESFDDEKSLLAFLKDKTGRGAATNKKWIADDQAQGAVNKFASTWSATFTDAVIEPSIRRFAKLIRPDSSGGPTAFQPGSVYVADSSHRGATGTHYTPRSLTEEIVKHTLDPLVYEGPSEGRPESEWSLRPPEEILALNICDPACGSGAFLVQACRYLADAIVESKRTIESSTGSISEIEILDARRQVAERCLHGVDINPMACEMAKLSLWLVTLGRDVPFTFLDHAIGCGDSLLGVATTDELVEALGSGEGTLFDLLPLVEEQLAQLRQATEEIRLNSTTTIANRARKEHLLKSVHDRSELLQALADIATLRRLNALDDAAASALVIDPVHRALTSGGDPLSGLDEVTATLINRLRDTGEEQVLGRPRFHWFIEFPYLHSGGFDAFVGNPPFISGTDLLPTLGRAFREHLVEDQGNGVRGRRGQVDICVYFVLRAVALSAEHSRTGLVAVNTISEGDSREVGLEQIVRTRSLVRANRSEPWPGVASLEIAKIWLGPKDSTSAVLNGISVPRIGPDLRPVGSFTGRAQRLAFRAGSQSIGSKPHGKGFILESEEAKRILSEAPEEEEVIRPFINAQDLNSRPGGTPSRYIVNFGDRSEAEASQFPSAFRIVEERVKPGRLAAGNEGWKAKVYEKWWQFREQRTEIYEWAEERGGLIAIARHSNAVMPLPVSSEWTVSDAVIVFRSRSLPDLALLSSAPHYWWAEKQCSSMRTDIRYTPTEIFETLPTIELKNSVETEMQTILDVRSDLGEQLGQGLTAIYKRVADPGDRAPEIERLRQAHAAIDEGCVSALGISGELRHGCYEHEYGMRFTPHPEIRLQVLDRILELNFETFLAEINEGLHPGVTARWIEVDGVKELVVEDT